MLLDTNGRISWEARADILHHRLERYEEALAAYQQALAEYAAESPGKVFMWSEIACLYRDLERYDDALTAYDRYLAGFPDDGDTLYTKADLLHELSRHAEALVVCDAALAAYRADTYTEADELEQAEALQATLQGILAHKEA